MRSGNKRKKGLRGKQTPSSQYGVFELPKLLKLLIKQQGEINDVFLSQTRSEDFLTNELMQKTSKARHKSCHNLIVLPGLPVLPGKADEVDEEGQYGL